MLQIGSLVFELWPLPGSAEAKRQPGAPELGAVAMPMSQALQAAVRSMMASAFDDAELRTRVLGCSHALLHFVLSGGAAGGGGSSSLVVGDRESSHALMELYMSTSRGAGGWTTRYGWETFAPNLSQWFGVTIDATTLSAARVTQLVLPRNGLHGACARGATAAMVGAHLLYMSARRRRPLPSRPPVRRRGG